MQSIEIKGLEEVQKAFDELPGVIKSARADVFEAVGQEILSDVQGRIGGSGRVAGVQEYRVGSGKGYVAVRAMADTELNGYAAGYVTNALENGHTIRLASGNAQRQQKSRAKIASVRGKHMYRDVREGRAEQLAESGAKRIEDAAVKCLNGTTSRNAKSIEEYWTQRTRDIRAWMYETGGKSWEYPG